MSCTRNGMRKLCECYEEYMVKVICKLSEKTRNNCVGNRMGKLREIMGITGERQR